ncbi:MAG: hypothetical protein KGY99_01415 [Phycisphaerae bacterium]|nr:hypothetical protein [Phycisphaerae bacterium]
MAARAGRLGLLVVTAACFAVSVADEPRPAPGDAETRPATPSRYPRVAMLWSPADVETDTKWANIARHDVIVLGPEALGLQWRFERYRGLAEAFEPESVKGARKNLRTIHEHNDRAVVLVEQYYFEDDKKAYPPEHDWWLRDEDGEKESFWPGTWKMDVTDAGYIAHVARRVEAIHKAADGAAGVFLDNVRYDVDSRVAWLTLLKHIRRRCGGEMPILVNAGYMTEQQGWLAPHVNGILYEDSIHYRHGRMGEEAFYERLAATDAKLRPLADGRRISINEVFGKRADVAHMRRELMRTLVYTNMAFLYADSTHGHHHGWPALWDCPLGPPVDQPATPRDARLARRRFQGGEVLWLPPSADEPATVTLEAPMRDAVGKRRVRTITLAPGSGAVLIRPDRDEAGP